MGAAPLVSVIIPTHNRAALLARAIRSVAAQSFTDLEVIVVDDGSSEDLESSLKAVQGVAIRLLRHDRQRGPAAARNTGIAQARGRYLAFLDSDDEWMPDKLERQIRFHRGVSGAAVSCTAYLRRRAPEEEWTRSRSISRMSLEDFLWGCPSCPGSTLMAEQAVFQRVGPFNENLRRLEDWDWAIRCVKHFEFHILDEALAKIHGSTSSPHVAYVLSALRLVEERRLDYGITSRHPLQWLKFKSTLLVERSATHYRAGENGKACIYGGLSVLVYPFRNRPFYDRVLEAVWHLVRRRPGA